MMEKDYLLRMFGQMARALTRLIFLKNQKDYVLALEFSDQLYHETLGISSGFINSISDEMLLTMLTSVNTLDVDKALIIATLLNAEGDIYNEMGNPNEGYYRHLKALNLYLALVDYEFSSQGKLISDTRQEINELMLKLEAYELPAHTQEKCQHVASLPAPTTEPDQL